MKLRIPTHIGAALVLIALSFLTACSKQNIASAANSTRTPPKKTAATSPTTSSAANTSPLTDMEKRMRDLNARMDSIFEDAFRNVGNWFDESMVAASIDLREQNGNYVTRVYVPHGNTAKADVKIDNGALHITMNDERTVNGKAEPEHYEQVIDFPKPVQSDEMRVDRKKNLIVITVPKQTASAPAVASAPAATPAGSAAPSTNNATAWEDSIFSDFNRIQNQMDQALRNVFPNNTAIGANTSQLESAVNLEDQKDKYVVHFYLPDRNLSDVKVDYKNGDLDLAAEEHQTNSKQTASGTMQSNASGRYEEMITIPGPVKDKDMTVNRQAGTVVVTLPKA